MFFKVLLYVGFGFISTSVQSEILCATHVPEIYVNQGQPTQALRVVEGEVETFIDDSMFNVADVTNGFYFETELGDGTLYFTLHLVDYKSGTRSHLRGSELYRQAFEHFGPESIRRVMDVYKDGDNLSAFQRAYDGGLEPEEAARTTWSGRQAASQGLTEVQIQDIIVSSGKVVRVSVIYSRP